MYRERESSKRLVALSTMRGPATHQCSKNCFASGLKPPPTCTAFDLMAACSGQAPAGHTHIRDRPMNDKPVILINVFTVAMRENPAPLPYLQRALAIAKFEPGMYEVVQAFSPPGANA
jgi:hypothetical protein